MKRCTPARLPEGFFDEVEALVRQAGDRIRETVDGTTNFIFGYQHSCVSVGLSCQGQMLAGFVYNPYVDSMYRAVRGQGAYLNGRKLELEEKSVSERIVSFGCARYNEGDTDLLFAAVKELYLNSLFVRNGGSAALELCRTAAGLHWTGPAPFWEEPERPVKRRAGF